MDASPEVPPPTPGILAEEVSRRSSTPFSKGPSSNNAGDKQNTRGDYKPYLLADIRDVAIISFDMFLESVYNIDTNWKEDDQLKDIIEDPKFKVLLEKYCDPITRESERYTTFNELANFVLGKLSKQPGIAFCRNDPVVVSGSYAIRRPDGCIVEREASYWGERDGWDAMSKNGPSNPFYWIEFLHFQEFKLEKKHLVVEKMEEAQGADRDAKSTTSPIRISGRRSVAKKHKGGAEASKGSAGGTKSRSQTHAEQDNAFLQPRPSTTTPSGSGGSSRKRALPDDSLEYTTKKVRTITRDDTLAQCASYALEMLSNGGLRFYALGSLITDGKLELLYYDHSAVVQSEPLNFLTNPIYLVGWIFCLHNLGSHPREWGQVPFINFPTSPTYQTSKPKELRYEDATLSLSNGVVLILGKLIFQQHGLIGRGTCVVHAHVKDDDARTPADWKNKSLVVKFSFTPTTRTPEGELLDAIIRKAKSDNEHSWVLKHLPHVLHYEVLPASDVQKRLSKHLTTQYEGRILHVLVMTEQLPVQTLTETKTLAPVIRHVFKCYRWLYETADVIHRDISVNNIMYREENGTIYGVLTDFDLSLNHTTFRIESTSNQRTGTKPYMAIDLLVNAESSPPEHLYRHDLESLFYVIVHLTTCYEDGKEVPKNPLETWFGLGAEQLAKEKLSFIHKSLPRTTSKFTKMLRWTQEIRNMFLRGYTKRDLHDGAVRRYYEYEEITSEEDQESTSEESQERTSDTADNFNYSTLGDEVTFNKYWKVLKIRH